MNATLPLPIYDCLPPAFHGAADEVQGHLDDCAGESLLRCWNCSGQFRIAGLPREDVYYECRTCHHFNLPDLTKPPGTTLASAPKISGSYRAPEVLDKIFLRGPGGSLFVIPRTEAARFRADGDQEMDHPPYVLDADEVAGHHKVASGSAADPAAWGYHADWHYGCYFDASLGSFCMGIHRHPWGDERAVGATESDFS